MNQPHIVIFIPSFGDGGVERMLVNLASGLAGSGAKVSFVTKRPDGAYLDRSEPSVERVVFKGTDEQTLVLELVEFLRERRPAVVMSAKERDDRIALAAKRQLVDTAPRFFLRVGTSIRSREQARKSLWFRGWQQRRTLKDMYAQCEGLLANSEGVARELVEYAGLNPERIHIVPNPTVTPDLEHLAREPVDHPWFAAGEPPVILGIGRLCRAKGFSTLIQAFAELRKGRDCRLVILGEGGQRPRLESLANRLGIADDIDLPGFVTNPFSFLARAALFALSSQREGCPNVLVEALAVGTPVVSTDCPSGPREILDGGRYGPLVPMNDAQGLAAAMATVLDHPLPSAELRAAVKQFTLENSSRAYLRAFGFH